MRGRLRDADIAIRKSYLRLFVERIEVDDDESACSATSAICKRDC